MACLGEQLRLKYFGLRNLAERGIRPPYRAVAVLVAVRASNCGSFSMPVAGNTPLIFPCKSSGSKNGAFKSSDLLAEFCLDLLEIRKCFVRSWFPPCVKYRRAEDSVSGQ
jgi:hypothetical protein